MMTESSDIAGRLRDRVERTWLEGRERFSTGVTGAVMVAFWLAVVPSKENRLAPQAPPDQLPERDEE